MDGSRPWSATYTHTFTPHLTTFFFALLGFAVVHMMLDKVRKRYELEKLWTLGPKFDDQTVAMHENSDT